MAPERQQQIQDQFKEKIDWLAKKIEQSTNGDEKSMLKDILRDIIYHCRIVSNEYFYLTDEETKRAYEFYLKNVKGRHFGAIGGGMTYHITPTGLGNIVIMSTRREDGQQIEEDITEFTSW